MYRWTAALRWFHDRARIAALGRDHCVSRATAHRYFTASPSRITEITRAAFVCTQFEHEYHK